MNIRFHPFRNKRVSTLRNELKEMQPIVVMARGHSGTRVLAQVLNLLNIQMWSDQQRQSGDTNRKLSRTIKQIVKKDTFITAGEQYHSSSRIMFEKAVYNYYRQLGRPGSNWGWKFPETYLIAPIVFETFPKARFIHFIRDGRDIAFKNHLTDDPTRKIGRKILKRLSALNKPDHIRTALSWQFQVESFDQFKQKLSNERLLELTFENLCIKPQASVNDLCDFLNTSITRQCAAYINREINPAKVKQYQENDPDQILEVEHIIRDTLLRYDYELTLKK
jgi:hypothetical protein